MPTRSAGKSLGSPDSRPQPAPRMDRAVPAVTQQADTQTTKEIVCPPGGGQHALKEAPNPSSYLASKHQRQSVVGASNFAVANHWCKTVRVLKNRGHSFQLRQWQLAGGIRTRCSPRVPSDSLDSLDRAAAAMIAAPCARYSHPQPRCKTPLPAKYCASRGSVFPGERGVGEGTESTEGFPTIRKLKEVK